MEYITLEKFDVVQFLQQLHLSKRIATENIACKSIQKVARGRRTRRNIANQKYASLKIQKIYRGHVGRKKIKHLYTNREKEYHTQVLNYFISQIQKVCRGFNSRRNILDYYKRQEYLKNVVVIGEEMRYKMDKYHQECLMKDEVDRITLRENELKSTAEKFHHMLSTSQQRGIFDPPPEVLETPTINNVPVEQVLRNVVRDLLRTKGIAKTTQLVPDLHGSKRLPLKLAKSRLSVQASSTYDLEKVELKRERDIHHIISQEHNKSHFMSGGKTTVIDDHNTPPLCTNEPYIDPYNNPLLKRGVPENQKELNQSMFDGKAYFIKKLNRPYYTRTEGNKSTVSSNDLFDVIAEAEEYGGSAQRYLGMTIGNSKYLGVPSTADSFHDNNDDNYNNNKNDHNNNNNRSSSSNNNNNTTNNDNTNNNNTAKHIFHPSKVSKAMTSSSLSKTLPTPQQQQQQRSSIKEMSNHRKSLPTNNILNSNTTDTATTITATIINKTNHINKPSSSSSSPIQNKMDVFDSDDDDEEEDSIVKNNHHHHHNGVSTR